MKKILKIIIPILVLLGIILLALFLKGKFFTKKEANPSTTPEPETISNEAQVKLDAQGPEGLTGQVNLFEKNNKTTTIIITPYISSDKKPAASSSAVLSAGIYAGTCQKPGEIKFRLSNIVQWQSQTVLSINFGNLKEIEPLVIDVRQNETATASSVSCGKINYRF